MAECPKCEMSLSSLRVEPCTGEAQGAVGYRVVTYSCPFCLAILSVGIDPVAFMAEAIDEAKKKLRGR